MARAAALRRHTDLRRLALSWRGPRRRNHVRRLAVGRSAGRRCENAGGLTLGWCASRRQWLARRLLDGGCKALTRALGAICHSRHSNLGSPALSGRAIRRGWLADGAGDRRAWHRLRSSLDLRSRLALRRGDRALNMLCSSRVNRMCARRSAGRRDHRCRA